jgi:hypothetical protein
VDFERFERVPMGESFDLGEIRSKRLKSAKSSGKADVTPQSANLNIYVIYEYSNMISVTFSLCVLECFNSSELDSHGTMPVEPPYSTLSQREVIVPSAMDMSKWAPFAGDLVALTLEEYNLARRPLDRRRDPRRRRPVPPSPATDRRRRRPLGRRPRRVRHHRDRAVGRRHLHRAR